MHPIVYFGKRLLCLSMSKKMCMQAKFITNLFNLKGIKHTEV